MKLQPSTLVRTPVLSLPRLATAEGPTGNVKDELPDSCPRCISGRRQSKSPLDRPPPVSGWRPGIWWELAMPSSADRTGGGSSRLGRSKNDERIKRVRILATVAVIILAGVLSGRGSDWTTWRADSARSGYTKDALPEKLALSWSWTPRHAPRLVTKL